jgi:hypothetical protein
MPAGRWPEEEGSNAAELYFIMSVCSFKQLETRKKILVLQKIEVLYDEAIFLRCKWKCLRKIRARDIEKTKILLYQFIRIGFVKVGNVSIRELLELLGSINNVKKDVNRKLAVAIIYGLAHYERDIHRHMITTCGKNWLNSIWMREISACADTYFKGDINLHAIEFQPDRRVIVYVDGEVLDVNAELIMSHGFRLLMICMLTMLKLKVSMNALYPLLT